MADKTILLVDDDSEALLTLSKALSVMQLEARILAAGTAEKALALLQDSNPHVAVLDLCLDERVGVESGFKLLEQFAGHSPACRIIVLTGHGSIEHGVRAIQLGAASFIEKPADIPHLSALIKDGLTQAELKRSHDKLSAAPHQQLEELVVGDSPAMVKVRQEIEYAARTNQTVLICGETGTGKGLCARAIHECSSRSQNHFVRYQPNFNTPDLVSSELFGHVKGAFTGAERDRVGLLKLAHNGTIFLDEIDELPLETQVALLGVIQEKSFRPVGSTAEERIDFRLICATNRSVEESLEQGRRRRDLEHRINRLIIRRWTLGEPVCDLPQLVNFILEELASKERVTVYTASEQALKTLANHGWPGNVRELQAVVEGAAYRAQFSGRTQIEADDIVTHSTNTKTGASYHDQVEAFKLKLIKEALSRNNQNQLRAAEELQLDRSTLRRILKREEKE
ncbi:MAG: sigma-54-dependent Fis family transcriptional regulator [Bdellovibrionales bacterium]|nr:sigma-54-dependent Fis family transcriptional regulator [Bdellovibrionales bacterium]